jgi:hypothetical protein
MAILSFRELPRTFNRRFGERFVAERQFVLTVDDDGTNINQVETYLVETQNIGLIGSLHPDGSPIRVMEVDFEETYEGSRHHCVYILRYGGDIQTDPDQFTFPTNRPAKWSFQTQGTTVPALFYFDQSGNASTKPLTNSANDYFSGLTSDEAQVKVIIQDNLTNFPSTQVLALTNTINSSAWLNGDPYTWKCQGINGELKYEVFGETLFRYWAVTVELLYRQTGWRLLLPDIGFNYLHPLVNQFNLPTGAFEKRRAMVFDFENGEFVASPNPVGLNGSGAQTLGAPAILQRRVHREVDFNAFFATPPA